MIAKEIQDAVKSVNATIQCVYGVRWGIHKLMSACHDRDPIMHGALQNQLRFLDTNIDQSKVALQKLVLLTCDIDIER